MTEQLDLLAFSLDARGAGHRLPVLDAPDIAAYADGSEAPEWAREGLGADWWAFHRAHPEVAGGLVRLARPLLRRGYTHLGLKMLWETLRYRTMLGAQVPDESPWRLNNNWTSFYARHLMETYPDLAGVFELRELRG